jgi:hypothetical protein
MDPGVHDLEAGCESCPVPCGWQAMQGLSHAICCQSEESVSVQYSEYQAAYSVDVRVRGPQSQHRSSKGARCAPMFSLVPPCATWPWGPLGLPTPGNPGLSFVLWFKGQDRFLDGGVLEGGAVWQKRSDLQGISAITLV